MRTLLHISDVHFGPPHRPRVAAGVRRLATEARPDLVVISGDLTQRAKPRQFRQARRFVESLPAPTLAVPGNHDVPMYRFWERLLAPFGAYRRHFSAELEPGFADDELLIVSINTAHGWTIEDGRITAAALARAESRLGAGPGDLCRIVIAHHQLIPPPRFGPQEVLRGARRATRRLAAAGVELVLSGHKHQGYVGLSREFHPDGGPPMVVAHSGTTTSSRGRGWERGRNTCNWIRIEDEAIHVVQLLWSDASESFTELARHRFPRRGRRGEAGGEKR